MWLPSVLIILTCFYSYSEDVCKRGFTVIIDMRGSKWDLIKPLLKTLQEAFPAEIHVALIIKPDNFWQKQKTNFGSSKFIFEVRTTWGIHGKALFLIKNVLQEKDFSGPVLEGKNGIRGLHPKGACPGTFWAHLWSGMLVSLCWCSHAWVTLVRVFLWVLFLMVLHSAFLVFILGETHNKQTKLQTNKH